MKSYLKLGLALGALSCLACGEEEPPPPNNAPTVVGAQSYARCELRERGYALTEVNFVIEDLEGSDTLTTPYVEYNYVSIGVDVEAIPAPTAEEMMAAEERGEELATCPVESCRARYSWSYSNSTENAFILCPEGDDPITVSVRILDQNTNEKVFEIIPMREE